MNIFTLTGSILVDNSKAIDSLQKTEDKADSFAGKLGKGIEVAGKVGSAVGAAAGVAGAALGGLVMNAADAAGALDDTAKRTGMSAEEYQKYAYAAKLSGMETETLEKAMIKQQKAFSDASEGSKTASDAYARLGIDITNVGSSSEAFDLVIARLAGMKDETERNALANDIFGKSYADLTPLLGEGADGIAKLKQEAVDMGAVMSNESVDAGAQFGDMLDSAKMALNGVMNEIGISLLPILQEMLDWVMSHMPEIKQAIKTAFDVAAGAVEKVSKLFDALKPILQILYDFVVWAFPVISEAVSTAFDIVVGVVEGVTSAFETVTDAIKKAYDWLTSWNNKEAKSKNVTVTETRESASYSRTHASGLAYVPYDGYLAELHRGERVMTASENTNLASQIVNGINMAMGSRQSSQPINLSINLDGKVLARQIYDPLQNESITRGKTLAVGV